MDTMEENTTKKIFIVVGVSFSAFIIVAVLIYINIDNILNLFDDMAGGEKDSDGHRGELIIPARDFEHIDELGKSIEEMVEQGAVGDIDLLSGEEGDEESVFTTQIQDLENRASNTPDLTPDEELNPVIQGTTEDIIDVSDFPDSPFDFNPR